MTPRRVLSLLALALCASALVGCAGGDAPGSNGFDRFQKEWTLWILLIVLLLTVGESCRAWLCGRSW